MVPFYYNILVWTTLLFLASKVQAVSVLCQVKDAIRSHRVAGAECNLLSNAGIFLKTAKSLSNSYGVAVIEKVQPGNYQVRASRIGYYTLSEYLTVAPDSEESKMIPLDLVISPKLSLRGNVDMYRIVLTWGNVPRDLDSYILTPWPTSAKCKQGRVFYNDRKCSHGSESIGLDVDATDMYGPETITLRGVESGSFSYYVHIYTNGVCWDKIRANVKVYQASTGGLLYNINQPKCSESGSGFSKFNCSRYWNVLTFDASTAKFKIHPGRFTNTAPTLTDHGLANPNCNCTGRAFITGNDVIQAATRLSEEAVKLNMEKLCIKEMEEIYNNADKKDIRLNPSRSVAKLATFVSNRIEEKRRLAIALKNLIKNQYEKHVRSSTSSPSSSDTNLKEIAQKQCCTYDGDKASYSTAFNKWVDMKSSCWSWPQEIKEMPHELVSVYEWTAPLEKLMMTNFDTTSQKGELKWQYFTDDKTGFHRRFPAEVLGNAQCGTSNQRLKPWYIEGVRGPKNIIILVDISYAMKEENKFMFARTAIVQVLKGMLNNDFTNVIAFAEAALLPGMTHGRESDDTYNSCLKSQLVQANEQNQKGLERFVQDVMLASEKTVNYYNAISTALRLVTNTMANNNRDTHLIFVTGSQDTSTESIPELLKNANTSITVHVYHLVGRSNNSYIRDSRAKLAEMAAVTNGKLETIYDYNNLAFRMGRFYKNMYNERPQSSDPYLSSPSFDERLGMYVTLGVPCYTDNKELIGVVGIDITLSELLKNTVAFGPGELSYTFVIETDTGRALVHPQLPLPGFIQNEPVVINIKYLEQSSGFSTVLASMMRRETGTKVLRSERVLSRGDPAFNGYRGIKSEFTYSWRPVNNTNFAVCVVVANDELDTKAMNIPKANPQPDLYHRYDIVRHLKVGSIIEDKPIAFLNNITFPATLSRSNYFLSSSCFNDPYRFENTPETLEFVKELSDFVDGKRSVLPMQALKKEVLADIRLTREIEQCWNRNPMRVLGADAAWRYIATNSGTMRQYPGRQTYNNRYDPTTRPWYHAAKSYPGKLTFSVPYLDNGGAGVVVTTSQTISSVSMVRAVMGIDWKMKKINEIVTGSGAICQQASVACILIDPNGYVVYSRQFIFKPSITKKRVHLAYKHPELLRDLMKKGVISTSLACNDLELGQTYINYKIADYIPDGKVEGTTRCGSYIMVPVPNTNVYLIALDGGDCPDTTVKCRSCSKTSCADGITKDRSTTIPICVPCVCSVRYNPCALHYYQSPNAAVVCPSTARSNINTKTACKKPDTDSTVLKGPKTVPKTASPPPKGNGKIKGAAPTQNNRVDTILSIFIYVFLALIFY